MGHPPLQFTRLLQEARQNPYSDEVAEGALAVSQELEDAQYVLINYLNIREAEPERIPFYVMVEDVKRVASQLPLYRQLAAALDGGDCAQGVDDALESVCRLLRKPALVGLVPEDIRPHLREVA